MNHDPKLTANPPSLDATRAAFLNALYLTLFDPTLSADRKRSEVKATLSAITQMTTLAGVNIA